jgi:uncharacterized membrane protein YeiH
VDSSAQIPARTAVARLACILARWRHGASFGQWLVSSPREQQARYDSDAFCPGPDDKRLRQMSDAIVQDFFTCIDLTGVLANAVLGGVMARSARMHPVGFIALAILSGLGGGLIRDTLLQHGTPVALTNPAYIPVALAGAAIAFFLPVKGLLWNRAFLFVDALALGCWAATGALKTLTDGLPWLPALLLGTITAVGGGMTRDVFLRQVPRIFVGGTLYTTSAVLASGVMVSMYGVGDPFIGLGLATVTGAGLTLLAAWRGWGLPQAPSWQPSQAWSQATQSYRARIHSRHQEPLSDFRE